jgi:hypothetical protein
MDTELMNAYIQRQNRMIGELINQKLMLEAQLEIANKNLLALKPAEESNKEDKAYK